MANEQNLKPFEPGKSGNPKGRPRGTENSRTRLYRLFKLKTKKKNPFTGKDEKYTVLEQMDVGQALKAIKGDTHAYRELLDRYEGKAAQAIELTGKDGEAIKIEQITGMIIK